MTFEMEWFGDKVLAATRSIVDGVSKDVAEDVLLDAQKILKKKAKTTTEKGLLSQMSVIKSKFADGGYIVSCQGPKNITGKYHSSFVELGTFKDVAKPFMRPATRKNKNKANKKYREALE